MRCVFYFYYMHDFLKDVTKDIFNNNVNISDCIIILPNKRSGFFLKEEINFQVSNTIFSPKIYEIDDFMSLVSGVEKNPKKKQKILKNLFHGENLYL